MALRNGDRVIFTKAAGGFVRPRVRKGTHATVTRAEDGGLKRRSSDRTGGSSPSLGMRSPRSTAGGAGGSQIAPS
jgi:hypothetical protein